MQPLLIGGEHVETADALPNVNPSDPGDTVAHVAQAGRHEAEIAVAASRDAAPGRAAAGPLSRHEVLRRTAEEMMARREELGRELSREEGKPLKDGIAEATRAAHIFGFFAGEALRLTGETGNSVRPGIEVAVTREPAGVVGLITPWNFPLAIPAWKMAPALACGNAVILKPAEMAPSSAWAIADILHRAGAPPGVVNLVTGPGGTVGQALVDSPDVDAISFTGSVATGRHVAEGCARAMRRVQLEMGGKNPLVVLDDADLDAVVGCGRCAPATPSTRRPRSAPSSTSCSWPRTRATSRSPGGRVPRCATAADANAPRRRATTCSPRCLPGPRTTCASTARRCSGPSPASSASVTTTRRWRSRTTPSSASVPASAPPASSTRPTSAGTAPRAW